MEDDAGRAPGRGLVRSAGARGGPGRDRREHDRLLRDVARARAALEDARALAAETDDAIRTELDPVYDETIVVLRELRATFDALLGPEGHFGKRDRARIRRVLETVLDGVPAELVAMADGGGSRGDVAGTERGARDPADPPPVPAPAAPPLPGRTVREVFRRLAVALHPDKVQDAPERERRTALMKQVTRAYDERDVASLLDLARVHGALPVEDPDARPHARDELRRQLRALTAARKAVLRELPFSSPSGDTVSLRERARRELATLVAEARSDLATLTRVRDFAGRFAAGAMTTAEFLAGPR